MAYSKIAQLKTVAAFRARLEELGLDLPVDDRALTAAEGSPLAKPLAVGDRVVGNRWCIHPMEGWDANRDGSPSEKTIRRWRHFGLSGAKLIWGGEAAAVQSDGRANPNQTLAGDVNASGLARLLDACVSAHQESFGTTDDLLVGLQLTHSGRFARPNSKALEPRVAYRHPILDRKFGVGSDDLVWRDDELPALIERFVAAAKTAREIGFRFVDVKACHGYLFHEFLSARRRPGPYGGDLAGRAKLLLDTVAAVKQAVPDLMVFVRLSAFDVVPYQPSPDIGGPAPYVDLLPYDCGFGTDAGDPTRMDLAETFELVAMLEAAGVYALNLSCGSPYYNPHVQRPAIFPPSDGYLPPEDPLVGVARQIHAAKEIATRFPDMLTVGTGYSYLQDYLPHVAQAVVREGWIDMVGLGRMVLSYPRLPADVLEKGELARKLVCRTFSDCTTAPRNGLVSGCYPLDPYYKALPENETMKGIKKEMKTEAT
jgi:2,4-dienoyl-CoA reductase-like NADH-dependent reductase (Old Yellow Enzyme family)